MHISGRRRFISRHLRPEWRFREAQRSNSSSTLIRQSARHRSSAVDKAVPESIPVSSVLICSAVGAVVQNNRTQKKIVKSDIGNAHSGSTEHRERPDLLSPLPPVPTRIIAISLYDRTKRLRPIPRPMARIQAQRICRRRAPALPQHWGDSQEIPQAALGDCANAGDTRKAQRSVLFLVPVTRVRHGRMGGGTPQRSQRPRSRLRSRAPIRRRSWCGSAHRPSPRRDRHGQPL